MTTPSDPLALLRCRNYLGLLVLAAIIGAPISTASPAPAPAATPVTPASTG